MNAHNRILTKELLGIYQTAMSARILTECLLQLRLRSIKGFAEVYTSKTGKTLANRLPFGVPDDSLSRLISKIPNPIFSAIGCEVGASAVATLLATSDVLIPHYRGFAALLGKGMPAERIVGEFLRKRTGGSKGIGDIAGFRDPEHGIPGYSANLGAMFSVAVGIALAKNLTNDKENIVTIFFGDGEASRNTFAGALNLAMLWKLPILFVCENNKACISMDFEHMFAVPSIANIASGYGMQNETVYEKNPASVCEQSKRAVDFVRKNRMPFLVEIMETRFSPHSSEYEDTPTLGKDIPPGEDPLLIFRDEIIKQGIPEKELAAMESQLKDNIELTIKSGAEAEELTDEEFLSLYNA